MKFFAIFYYKKLSKIELVIFLFFFCNLDRQLRSFYAVKSDQKSTVEINNYAKLRIFKIVRNRHP